MENLFNNILTNTSDEITVMSAVITMLVALAMGACIAFTYFKTRETATYQRSMAVTLMMLPIILSVIIVFIGSNIARAFSLAGTLSIIRFRSAPGEPKDIGFIFFDIAAGLACGVGLYGYGVLFVIILCAVMFLCEKFRVFEQSGMNKQLKITVPENLNFKSAFDDVLNAHTTSYTLQKIRTTDLGSLFELCYIVTVKKDFDEQKFLNELRCRNGNLSIILSESPKIMK